MSNGTTSAAQNPAAMTWEQRLAGIAKALGEMFSKLQQNQGQPIPGSVQKGQGPQAPPQGATPFSPSPSGGPLNITPPPAPVPMPMAPNTSVGVTGPGARNAGMVSLGQSLTQIGNTIEQRMYQKKVAHAEAAVNYINSLLATGRPDDYQKAIAYYEDPKVKKIIEKGLQWQFPEEEIPPEAVGVQTALRKAMGQAPQPQGQPMRQPMFPGPSAQQQLQSGTIDQLLKRFQQDPRSAITAAGGSQLTSDEQRAKEFYEAGLGLSPLDTAKMTAAEQTAGMRLYAEVLRDGIKAEADIQKAQITAGSRVESAKIMAAVRDRISKAAIDAHKKGKGAAANYAAGAKVYEDYAKKYLDLSKQAGIDKDTKARYEAQAEMYQKKADDYLNQGQDEELMKWLMGGAKPEETPEE